MNYDAQMSYYKDRARERALRVTFFIIKVAHKTVCLSAFLVCIRCCHKVQYAQSHTLKHPNERAKFM